MRHYPLLSLIPRGPARPLQPCHGVGAPQYKRPRFRAQKMPSCGAFGQPSLSSWFNKLSTANIQINFNTVYAPAHFFSIFRRFCARSPIVTRSQPVPVGPFGAGRACRPRRDAIHRVSIALRSQPAAPAGGMAWLWVSATAKANGTNRSRLCESCYASGLNRLLIGSASRHHPANVWQLRHTAFRKGVTKRYPLFFAMVVYSFSWV